MSVLLLGVCCKNFFITKHMHYVSVLEINKIFIFLLNLHFLFLSRDVILTAVCDFVIDVYIVSSRNLTPHISFSYGLLIHPPRSLPVVYDSFLFGSDYMLKELSDHLHLFMIFRNICYFLVKNPKK